jgi:hypothetical protein
MGNERRGIDKKRINLMGVKSQIIKPGGSVADDGVGHTFQIYLSGKGGIRGIIIF